MENIRETLDKLRGYLARMASDDWTVSETFDDDNDEPCRTIGFGRVPHFENMVAQFTSNNLSKEEFNANVEFTVLARNAMPFLLSEYDRLLEIVSLTNEDGVAEARLNRKAIDDISKIIERMSRDD